MLNSITTVKAHGTFHTAHCLSCGEKYTKEWVRDIIFKDEIPKCILKECDAGLVKPDIVFFGEPLPPFFHAKRKVGFAAFWLVLVEVKLTKFVACSRKTSPNVTYS